MNTFHLLIWSGIQRNRVLCNTNNFLKDVSGPIILFKVLVEKYEQVIAKETKFIKANKRFDTFGPKICLAQKVLLKPTFLKKNNLST